MPTVAPAGSVAVPTPTSRPSDPKPDTEAESLIALLGRAGEYGPGGADGVALRADAATLTARLEHAGRIPAHLRVRVHDPLVVVIRTLAVVARIVATSGNEPRR